MRATQIAVAVCAVFAAGSAFADFGDANVIFNENGELVEKNDTEKKITEPLEIKAEWNHGLWNSLQEARVGTMIMPNNDGRKSYVKNAGGTLSIGTLTLKEGQDSPDQVTKGSLEFYPEKANTVDKSGKTIEVNKVILEANSSLRVMKSNDSNTAEDQNGNGKFIKGNTSVRFGEVTMAENTALAFSAGEAHQKINESDTENKIGMPDSIIIDHITVNGEAEIVSGYQASKQAVVQVGSIDINNGSFSFGNAGCTAGMAYDSDPNASKSVALIALNKSIRINMNTEDSVLYLGYLGTETTPTALDIYFNEEALDSQQCEVKVSDSGAVKISQGSSLQVIAADGILSGLTPEATAQKLADKVFNNNSNEAVGTDDNRIRQLDPLAERKATVAASGIDEGYTYDIDQNGKIISSSVVVTENTTTHALSQLSAVNYMQWRSAMNHLQYRMGELRDHSGLNNGAWIRAYNGKDKYGSQDVKNTYYGFQAGYDHRPEGTNILVGGAVSYAHGDSDFRVGDGNNYNYHFTGYGTWLADNGLFLDGTFKVGRLSNDVTMNALSTAGAGKASYETNAFSVSAELGWRFNWQERAYIEPQAEIMYGRINSADYTFRDISVTAESVESTVGRLGLQTGFTCPSKKGGAYLRASVLHDFQGTTRTRFATASRSTTISEDLGDTWYELGIGANYNLTDTTYFYADVNYAAGGEVESPWRWSIGVRHAF